MFPVEYQCNNEISIRRCPEFISCIGNKPAYWYLKRELHPWDDGMLETYRLGYRVLYWSGAGWQFHTPKQFATAELAYLEFTTVIQRQMVESSNED